MSSEQEAVPDTGKLDTGLTIVRVLIAVLAIFPILPFCLIVTVGPAIPANSDLEAVVFGMSQVVTLLGSTCAALLMPVFQPLGVLASPPPSWRLRRRTQDRLASHYHTRLVFR